MDKDVTVLMSKVIIIIVIIDTFPTYYVWNISGLDAKGEPMAPGQ